ncbi:MAG TPA: hypothetical protein VH139_07055 [Acidobacteriaceae bacterium]|jgi:hypothetical protein|nr:hypothetical protein [Acidobacteriaceae bacterium]
MRSLLSLPFAAALLVVLVVAVRLSAQHPPPPAQAADQYPAFERHAGDHITVAVDPYDTQTKVSIFRADYASVNIIPVRIIITNEGDTPISLNNARIDFITAAGDNIPAAEPSDAERALDRPADPRRKIPIGPIKVGGKGKNLDKKIEQDFSELEYRAIAVEPHTTRAGFLFYDLQDVANPLQGAHLELRRIQSSDGRELFAFEIPFDKYLASKK